MHFLNSVNNSPDEMSDNDRSSGLSYRTVFGYSILENILESSGEVLGFIAFIYEVYVKKCLDMLRVVYYINIILIVLVNGGRMEAKEEICRLMKRFVDSMPRAFTTKIEKTNIGIGLVLRYLAEVGRPASAGEISRRMNVSTARVAVLLRTMSEKGLIVRSADSADARKVYVSLSEKGRERSRKITDELIALMTEIVNKVGIARMERFIETANEINAVVTAKIANEKE